MSKAADKALAESMGRRRPREAIQAEVADSVQPIPNQQLLHGASQAARSHPGRSC